MPLSGPGLVVRAGGCHCGAVRFEIEAAPKPLVQTCTCSICRMTGYVHLTVPASRFRLNRGADALTEYRFNTGVARHLFCKHCGVKSFYVPRSHPHGYSINARCLDDDVLANCQWLPPFDDAHRDAATAAVAHLADD
ncbi:MAG TPA: GFA family protein [Rhodanobacteraceae bacterium]|nr:GFA family protein [Rhodanobacteraceae bacterium]